jgi:hypothetical protein
MYRLIDIEDLLFDEENPRLEDILDQNDALEKVILDQGRKLVNLAQDIIEMRSTNPSELPIVMPSPSQNDKYIVLEGNRRLAVLRLLRDVSLIARIEDSAIKSDFHKLYLEFHKSPISQLQCYIAKNRQEADHWRKLRHTGENNGVGTIRWDTAASTRFSDQLGIGRFSTVALQIIDHLQNEPSLSSTSKQKLDKVKMTNFARLINDPDIRNTLGLKTVGGALDSSAVSEDVVGKLEVLIDGITATDFKVKQIYGKKDRQAYLEWLGIVSTPQDQTTSTGNGKSQQTQDNSKKVKKSNPLSTARKTLIPPTSIMKIGHSRLNKIYRELRKLEVDDFENCVAVMLRVFLELSIDEYAITRSIPGYSTKGELRNKVKAAITYMEQNDILNSNKLKAIRLESENPHSLISSNTLNAYVHNKDLEPKSRELKITWNNIEPFIIKLWE